MCAVFEDSAINPAKLYNVEFNLIVTELIVIMQSFPSTFILRHRRENKKKCSLKTLESNSDFIFLSYPSSTLPQLSTCTLLGFDGPLISREDSGFGLFIIDATWRYAEKMGRFVDPEATLKRRSLPKGCRTAYPRKQSDCPFPDQGLASIEAIYLAYLLMGRDTTGLLDGYYWKDEFLKINKELLTAFQYIPLPLET